MKKVFSTVMLASLIVSMLTLAFNVQPVRASETIYIRADGSVEGTTQFSSLNNITYMFTGNIYDSIVVERSNIIIDGAGYMLQGSGSGNGFDWSGINNVTIQNTNIKNFFNGIWLVSSSSNSILGNNITANNGFGIRLDSSSNYNSIQGNSITNNGYGIRLFSSSNNNISGNNITANNTDGIDLSDSSNNSISGNTITANIINGIRLDDSSDNTVYHNNFINTQQVLVTNSANNTWDNGFEGNYWSNYTGLDLDPNGVGDSPHSIDTNNTDRYPLMGMFQSFNTSLNKYVNVISNSTVDDFEYFDYNSTIKMHVSNMTGNQTHGFIRIAIPYTLMSEPYNVSIEGADPTYWNYTLHDNGTHRWIYFEYQHSTVEIVIIPEFSSLIILPLFMTLTLSSAIVFKKCSRRKVSNF